MKYPVKTKMICKKIGFKAILNNETETEIPPGPQVVGNKLIASLHISNGCLYEGERVMGIDLVSLTFLDFFFNLFFILLNQAFLFFSKLNRCPVLCVRVDIK